MRNIIFSEQVSVLSHSKSNMLFLEMEPLCSNRVSNQMPPKKPSASTDAHPFIFICRSATRAYFDLGFFLVGTSELYRSTES
jgi:hypothetical protein